MRRNFSAMATACWAVGLGQQDREFLSAVAAHHINLAQLLVEERRNLAQNFVSQQVSELVVQRLN